MLQLLKPDAGFRSRMLRFAPTWQANLLVFGCLIGIFLGLVYWQVRSSERTFVAHVKNHGRLLASVIQAQANTAVLSKTTIEAIMQTFLGNTARFVDYLDAIEPFSPDELAALARENGLAGIRIRYPDDEFIQGPRGWAPDPAARCGSEPPGLSYAPENALYYLSLPRPEGGCVLVGFQSREIQSLRRKLSLQTLLETLSDMAEIKYVRIIESPAETDATAPPEVSFIDKSGSRVAEARMALESDQLVIGLDAAPYFKRSRQLWTQFFILGGITAVVGLLLSWGLYRYQSAYVSQTRAFERRLAREKEDAALGRATAAIAHELRNPLNAISMGLQRLNMETPGLSSRQSELIASLLASVRRSNGLIADLQQFARPIKPARQKMRPHALIASQLRLYEEQAQNSGIAVNYTPSFTGAVSADADLMAIVFENLIRNALEAQPGGGHLIIRLDREGDFAVIEMENPGLSETDQGIDQLIEPYVTSKTRGTGLGLSMVDRIIRAHGGTLELFSPQAGILRVRIMLSITGESSRQTSEPTND